MENTFKDTQDNDKYKEFVKWVNEKYPDTKPWTGNGAKFLNQLINIAESDEEFKKRLTEIGPKEDLFILLYRFYKDTK